jgi:hypothetical protein
LALFGGALASPVGALLAFAGSGRGNKKRRRPVRADRRRSGPLFTHCEKWGKPDTKWPHKGEAVDGTWLSQHTLTVAAAALTSSAISLARHAHAESKCGQYRKRGCWARLCAAGSVATLSLGVCSAVTASLVERLSPWQSYAAAVLLTATVDVTSIKQLQKLASLTLRTWLAAIDSSENGKEKPPTDPPT